jgi:surface polysaccharide O-acyltransferase-like enzyme
MNERVKYFDYLRVFAVFSVIILHLSAQNWFAVDVGSYEWQIFNCYDSIVRMSVPIFVMISGAIFLNRNHDVKKIYGKYIPRMIIAFVFWAMIYAFAAGGGKMDFFKNTISGHYHMWFIPMIVCLYMYIPIICKIVECESVMKYFLTLGFIFQFFIPYCIRLMIDFGSSSLVILANSMEAQLNDAGIHLFIGYTFYFVLGLYLSKLDMSRNVRKIIYLFAIIGAIATVLLNVALTIKNQTHSGNYYGNFTINVLMESVGAFVFFKYNVPNSESTSKIMSNLAEYSFGAYLVHALIIEMMANVVGIDTLSFYPIISVPFLAILVFILSFVVSALVKKIPFINEYIT